jgi:hypothetical protein
MGPIDKVNITGNGSSFEIHPLKDILKDPGSEWLGCEEKEVSSTSEFEKRLLINSMTCAELGADLIIMYVCKYVSGPTISMQ